MGQLQRAVCEITVQHYGKLIITRKFFLSLTLSHFNKEKVNGRKNGKREDV